MTVDLFVLFLSLSLSLSTSRCSSRLPFVAMLCSLNAVDVWDGTDMPVVCHGNTLTTKIAFCDVITIIAEYAFDATKYVVHPHTHTPPPTPPFIPAWHLIADTWCQHDPFTRKQSFMFCLPSAQWNDWQSFADYTHEVNGGVHHQVGLGWVSMSIGLICFVWISWRWICRYPLIIHLENHCSIPQQRLAARIMRDVFGTALYIPEEHPNKIVSLCSPEELSGKIIIAVINSALKWPAPPPKKNEWRTLMSINLIVLEKKIILQIVVVWFSNQVRNSISNFTSSMTGHWNWI